MKNESKTNIDIIWIFTMFFLILIMIGAIFMYQENRKTQQELNFYKNESVREAVILRVKDCCVYVFDDYVNKLIEIDIFPEIIYTTIETGDIAIYVVDFDYTDADLIGIEKRV